MGWSLLPRPWSKCLSDNDVNASSVINEGSGIHFLPWINLCLEETGDSDKETEIDSQTYRSSQRKNGQEWDSVHTLPAPLRKQSDIEISNRLSLQTFMPYERLERHHSEESPTQETVSSVAYQDALDRINSVFAELTSVPDETSSNAPFSPYHFRKKTVIRLSWSTVYERIFQVNTDEPASASIVLQICRDHGHTLRELSRSPRRLLLRKREEERVERIQELDSHCLRDFIQRPGRTLAEKAGSKGTLLSIIRKETVDTLENRILRRTIEWCEERSTDYLREHKSVKSVSKRCKTIVRFHRECHLNKSNSHFQEIGKLTSNHIKPNYVLTKDARYKEVWSCYRILQDEEKRRRAAWQWSREFFGQFIQLLILSILHADSKFNHQLESAQDDVAYLRRTPLKGEFLHPVAISSRFKVRNSNSMLDIIGKTHSRRYRACNKLLRKLLPDFSIMKIDESGGNILIPCWFFLPPDQAMKHGLDLLNELNSTIENLEENRIFRILPIVFIGDTLNSEDPKFCSVKQSRMVYAPLQGLDDKTWYQWWSETFATQLSKLLELEQ
jgi:Domain of unknown function (DUF2357)